MWDVGQVQRNKGVNEKDLLCEKGLSVVGWQGGAQGGGSCLSRPQGHSRRLVPPLQLFGFCFRLSRSHGNGPQKESSVHLRVVARASFHI